MASSFSKPHWGHAMVDINFSGFSILGFLTTLILPFADYALNNSTSHDLKLLDSILLYIVAILAYMNPDMP